jgi:hypothetical protein
MATQAQITANGLNSQKSTGPRTEAGLATSSANSLKHGLTARKDTLPRVSVGAGDYSKSALAHLQSKDCLLGLVAA